MDVLAEEHVGLPELAEQLIRTWSLGLEQRCKSELSGMKFGPGLLHRYITLSAENGIDASPIAESLAAKLGWQSLSCKLLDFLCVQYDWRINLLDYANESAAEWFENNLGRWLMTRICKPSEYIQRFGNIVLLAAQHASYVFDSTLAPFVLPPDCGLNVRIVAPLGLRKKKFAERFNCNQEDAGRQIREREARDAKTVRRSFHRNINDSESYDLVLNVEHTPGASAVDLIIGDYLMRFAPTQVCCAFRIGEDRESQRL